MAREWGFWTRGKLQMLRDYLDAFTTASKSSQEILYFDLFAGQAENTERFTKEPIKGSPWVALSIEDAPFTRGHAGVPGERRRQGFGVPPHEPGVGIRRHREAHLSSVGLAGPSEQPPRLPP